MERHFFCKNRFFIRTVRTKLNNMLLKNIPEAEEILDTAQMMMFGVRSAGLVQLCEFLNHFMYYCVLSCWS